MAQKQSILGRISQLTRANINSLLDKAEDPQKMLDQLVRDYTSSIAEAEDVIKPSVASSQDTRKVLQLFLQTTYLHQLNTVHHQEEEASSRTLEHTPKSRKRRAPDDKMPEVRPNPHLLHHQPTN